MDNYFIVGDIHGENNLLTELLLKNWNPDNERLVLLGDLIDRGPNSYDTVIQAMKLKKDHDAIVLKGNHEELFLNWLNSPNTEVDLYYPQGGRETIHSFFNDNVTFHQYPEHIANVLKLRFTKEVDFIRELPSYHETDDYIFVHAGLDLELDNWKETTESDMRWIRREFHYGENKTGKTIFFGHTPTYYLNKDKSHNVWFSPCGTKIDLDGAAYYGGFLHGLATNNGNFQINSVSKKD